MPFVKGQSGNPAGKRKGTRSRTTIQLQQALLRLLDDHLETLSEDFKSMKAKDRASLLITLAKHVTPPALNPDRLTEEQLEQIVEFLQKEKK
ncbi:MAG TPA: DUF5681 domain-containing protein [Thermodesulfobacteriota bacterium]|nr:DUF5681 domain-containing protein [Thermodesulfobacteriota bacterium]